MSRRLGGPLLLLAATLAGSPAFAQARSDPPAPKALPPHPFEAGRKLILEQKYAEAAEQGKKRLVEIESQTGPGSLEAARVIDIIVDAVRLGGRASAPEVTALADRAVEIKTRLLGPSSAHTLLSLRNRALLLSAQGKQKEAGLAFEQILKAAEETEPKDPEIVGRSWSDLASSQYRQSKYREAKASYEKALATYEAAWGPSDRRLIGTLRNLTLPLVALSDLPGAIAHIHRALEIAKPVPGEETAEAADLLSELGRLEGLSGRYDEAIALQTRALGAIERRLGPDHVDVAAVLRPLAVTWFRKGDYAQSRDLNLRALAILERALGPESPRLQTAINNLGASYAELGQLDEARAQYQRALAMAEAVSGPNSSPVALALQNLAAILAETSNRAEALRLQERALNIELAVKGPQTQDVASLLATMADVEQQAGLLKEARLHAERALEVSRALLGPTHPGVAYPLLILGRIRRDEGDRAGAAALFEETLRIREQAVGPQSPEVAVVLVDLASANLDLGRADLARAQAERGLAIFQAATPDHARVGWALGVLSSIDDALGRVSSALDLRRQALAVARKVNGDSGPFVADELARLADLLARAGETEEASRAAAQAEDIRSESIRLAVRYLPEEQALTLSRAQLSARSTLLRLAVSGNAEARLRAFETAARSRALVLDELLARNQTVFANEDEGVRARRSEVDRTRTRLATLLVRGPGKQPAGFIARLGEARQAAQAAEIALAEASARFRSESGARLLRLDDVLAALPPGAALVSYFRTDGPAGPGRALPPARYAAFVAGNGAPLRAFDLGPVKEVDDLIESRRAAAEQFAHDPSRGVNRALASDRDLGERIRRLVFDPLREAIGETRRVVVVPDGPLALMNFASLPDGGSRYLVDRFVFHTVSSERDLLVRGTRRGSGLLAVGDPSFDHRARTSSPASPTRTQRGPVPVCGPSSVVTFARLPSTRNETARVSRIFRADSNEPVSSLQGDLANEASVKRLAIGRRVLHFATHGFSPSCAEGSNQSVEGPASHRLAGLALAGANNRTSPQGDDDGILTSEEVGGEDLTGVEWAVLSACGTGLGETRSGEGILGLRRAFQVAGARTLITSLGPVEDQTTERWMGELYRQRFALKAATMDAVHAATTRALSERRKKGLAPHPFFWASFVASGDWR